MKKLSTIFTNMLLLLSCVAYSKEEKLNVTQTIAYNVSEKNNSLIFILKNNEKENLFIDNIDCNRNASKLINRKKVYTGLLVNRGSQIVFPNNSNLLWISDEKFLVKLWNDYGKHKHINNNFIALNWNFSSPWSKKMGTKSHIYLCKSLNKANNTDFITMLDKKDAINLKIAKVMDGKNLDFALIISNNTKHSVVVPNFFSEKSKLRLNFSNDDELIYHEKNKDNDFFKLNTGESKFIRINLMELFKKQDLTIEDFNGGITKLIWELQLSDKKTVKTVFNLVKIDRKLPRQLQSLGIFIDDTEVFEIPEKLVYPEIIYWQDVRKRMKN
ncbi:hypothetical protein AAEX28_02110 [Lentisphaerota bacterium WC36G]|nr:hypothetical protein LJT99_04995 [Lentisphaerae bacterium WC36]